MDAALIVGIAVAVLASLAASLAQAWTSHLVAKALTQQAAAFASLRDSVLALGSAPRDTPPPTREPSKPTRVTGNLSAVKS